MASASVTAVPLERLTIARGQTIALVGNPNSGKSTVFNRLTGLRQKTANYPGVTVEKRVGRLQLDNALIDLIDLPGTYALSPASDDERIAVDVLLGRVPGTPRPDAILAVVDATRLYQGLYLLEQLAELEQPMVVALTMSDTAIRRKVQVDTDALGARLGGVEVCTIVAPTGRGIATLQSALKKALLESPQRRKSFWPKLREAAEANAGDVGDLNASALSIVEIERALIDSYAIALDKLRHVLGERAEARIQAERAQL
jgi:ferrous iron transport protein B